MFKQGLTVVLILSFIILTVPTINAQEITVENEVVMVAENKLVELSARQKFDDLVMIMKELVKQEIKTESEIAVEAINIVDFELVPQEGFKIYYN